MSSKAKTKSAKSKSSSGSRSKGAKSMTKSQFVGDAASRTGLTKAQIGSVLGVFVEIVGAELKAGRPVVIPGLVKVTKHHKAATPARPGINPFTKEPIQIRAKPARSVLRAKPVKALKDMV